MRRSFWTTAQLQASGWSKQRITNAVAADGVAVVRRGHYALPDAPAQVVRAVRVGGVATAATAGRALGLWVPPDARLHVALPHGASRLRDPDHPARAFTRSQDVCLHWSAGELDVTTPTRVAPVLLVLEHAFACLPPEHALTMLDSALHQRLLARRDLAALMAALPAHLAPVVAAADALAESGIETIARYRLRLAGLRVEVQVVIAGVGRVDLLAEGRLIVELDGRETHDEGAAFERDRGRDVAAAIGGYRTLRLSYRQVLFDWRTAEAAVFAALALS